MLTAAEVSVRFGPFIAVDSMSLEVPIGKVQGLIGPNGAGKSTFLNAIAGRVPAAGIVKIGERDVSRLREFQRVRVGLGIKFQVTTVLRDETVLDNVLVAAANPARPLRLLSSRKLARERTEELLHDLGLADRRDVLAGELSHGEQQWLEIAMAMAQGPTVLLLDEPTSGMGRAETEATVRVIREKIRPRAAVIVVEHDMAFIRALCDEVTVMHQGKLFTSGTPAQLSEIDELRALYFGHARMDGGEEA